MTLPESIRMKWGLRFIDEAAACGQCATMDNKELFELFCRIYTIAHTLENKKCRKNHKEWLKELDNRIRKELR